VKHALILCAESQVLISFEAARAGAADLKFKLESAQVKEQERTAQYAALEASNKNLLSRVAAAEDEVGSLRMDIAHVQEREAGLLHEVDGLHTELDSLAQQRQHENDIWAEKYLALQTMHEAAARETQAKTASALEDAKRRTSDALLDRRKAEEQFHKMQTVNLSLNAALEKHRSDHESAIDSWVAARTELEAQIQALRRVVSSKDSEIEMRRAEETKNRATDMQTIKDLKQLISSRTTDFVELLSSSQKAAKSLYQELVAGKSKLADLTNQTLLLKNFCLQLHSKLSLPVSKLQPELDRVFETLFEKLSGVCERHDTANDDLATLRVAVEEEKRRAVLAEEEISRTERRLSMASADSKAEVGKVQQQLLEAQQHLQAAESDRAEIEARLQRTQEALDAVSEQAHNLQLENQKLQGTVRDKTTSDTTGSQADPLIDKMDQMTRLLKQSESDRVDKDQKINSLQEQIKALIANIKSLDETNKVLKRDLKVLQTSKDSLLQPPTTSTTAIAVQQYQLQLKQTQDLLKVQILHYRTFLRV